MMKMALIMAYGVSRNKNLHKLTLYKNYLVIYITSDVTRRYDNIKCLSVCYETDIQCLKINIYLPIKILLAIYYDFRLTYVLSAP